MFYQAYSPVNGSFRPLEQNRRGIPVLFRELREPQDGFQPEVGSEEFLAYEELGVGEAGASWLFPFPMSISMGMFLNSS